MACNLFYEQQKIQSFDSQVSLYHYVINLSGVNLGCIDACGVLE